MPLPAPSSSSWKNLFIGGAFDAPDDQQANSGNDIVGNASNAMMQACSSGSGDSKIYFFRARMGDANPSTTLYLGFDLNRDGRADLFVEANVTAAAGANPFVAFHKSDPTKDGSSPATTGWLNSSNDPKIQIKISSDDSYIAKTSAGTNVDGGSGASGTDSWIEFGFRLADLKLFAKSALGFDTVSDDSLVSLFLFTSTGQTANGDIGGTDDKVAGNLTKTWTDLVDGV